jgi:hypothetical protein
MRPHLRDPPVIEDVHESVEKPRSFDAVIAEWVPLTFLLNNLNRGLGLPDGYPFVLSGPATEKLRFVHDAIQAARRPTVKAVAALVPRNGHAVPGS